MSGGPTDWLRAAIGDDGTGPLWRRLNRDGREMIRLAYVEAREFGHPGIADEHLVLGLLRHGTGPAAGLLRDAGLDPPTVRSELLRLGTTLAPRVDPAAALRSVGIDADDIRQRLTTSFGTAALTAAERRVRRRRWWRGGYARPSPLCVYLPAKRSFHLAIQHATRRGDHEIGTEHLLYGVLSDALDPLGTQLSRRGRRQLATVGFIPGRPNPVRLLLEAHHIDPSQLAAQLSG